MAIVNGYQPGYTYYPPQTGYYPTYPGYPGTTGYGNDAYSQGYQQGVNGASGTANTVAGWGNAMTNGSVSAFGAINGVVGTAANLLGGVSNMLTGLFGPMGTTTAYPQNGTYYQQPNYYGQQGYTGAVGPAWGADMAQAQQQVWQQASSLTSKYQADNLIERYGDQARDARLAMDTQAKTASTAVADLQAAVGRLQAQGGPNSAQGQAILAEIATLKDRALSALTELDNSSRKVYVAALSAQFAYQYSYQRFSGGINASACQKELGRAWSFYNGSPAERLHWYSLSKTSMPNAIQMQQQSRAQVTSALTQLDNMLKAGH